MESLETFDIETWNTSIPVKIQTTAIEALEEGKVLYFPSLPFFLDDIEQQFLNPEKVNPKSKNISYDLSKDRLGGTLYLGDEATRLKEMMKRYAITSENFLKKLLPHYNNHLIQAKTSFRPVEILGRSYSWRKDDTRLHVDAFPSNPTQGQRILRIFTNINSDGRPRVWRLGEPFRDVVKNFAPKASNPLPGVSTFLKFLGITKDYRTAYDHYMLQIHDRMKEDLTYQKHVHQKEMKFPFGSSWIVYTDQVSHAAMQGQHVLEQTFHLPIQGLKNKKSSPLEILENFFNRPLI